MSNSNKILWTATNTSLPGDLWSRLEERGYKVLVAEEKKDITVQLKKQLPKLWVGMMNGDVDADATRLRGIRSEYPDVAMILISSNPGVEEAVRALKVGASDYVAETAPPERLWAALEGALEYPAVASRSRSSRSAPTADRTPAPVAVDRSMQEVLRLAQKVARSRATVLLQGESGTGKEVIARHIHESSDRRREPFVAVNCAALPETLMESELFGYEKGAFTGAVARKKGKFELAHGGTILLDEISEMALAIQAKLLRVLQERQVDRVGGEDAQPIDARVIATTNRKLEEETGKGKFRRDLFFRLNVVPIVVPPLRERREDIVPLAAFFLERHCSFNGVVTKGLTSEAGEFLRKQSWPGNVRELENLIERTVVLIDAEVVDVEDLHQLMQPGTSREVFDLPEERVVPLKEMEKRMIMHALDDLNGNRTHAAKVLGISVRTLRNKLHEYRKDLAEEAASSVGR
jgi:two-component system response regulator FlrC